MSVNGKVCDSVSEVGKTINRNHWLKIIRQRVKSRSRQWKGNRSTGCAGTEAKATPCGMDIPEIAKKPDMLRETESRKKGADTVFTELNYREDWIEKRLTKIAWLWESWKQ